MQVPKDMVVSMIEQRFGGAQAQQAAQQLPDQVDHEQHAGLLSQFGIDPQELAGQSGGGGQGQQTGGGYQDPGQGQGGGYQDPGQGQGGGYQDPGQGQEYGGGGGGGYQDPGQGEQPGGGGYQ